MSESQVINAMQVLARLYAEAKGFQNPQITVTRKKEGQAS